MKNPASFLEQTIHHEIPITRAMGISVHEFDGKRLVLTAPLSRNINHKSTAFGGSINTVATLSCWGFLFMILHNHQIDCRIVIQNSSINYVKPIHNQIRAICERPPGQSLQDFLHLLKRRGKSRISMKASVLTDDQVAVSFEGRFVAYKEPDKSSR